MFEIYSDIMFEINFSKLGFYVNQLFYAKELYILKYKTVFLKKIIYFSRGSIMIKIYKANTGGNITIDIHLSINVLISDVTYNYVTTWVSIKSPQS